MFNLREQISSFKKGCSAVDALYNNRKLKDTDFAFIFEVALIHEVFKTNFTLVESSADCTKEQT